jgi:hypothetical protein
MAIGRIPEPGTGIPESIVDAKGDIVTATAADTPARLAVGTNEQRLVADSAEATGLKYVADTTNYAIAAKGDLLVGTAADTLAVLSVGTNGHTLVADSSVSPTGLKWAAPANQSYSLINTGGTALTGAATITISGISEKQKLFVTIIGCSSATGNSNFYIRLNGDTGNNYGYFNGLFIGPDFSTEDAYATTNKMYIGAISSNAASVLSGYCWLDGCNSSGIKVMHHSTGSNNAGGTNGQFNTGGATWSGSATVSSISITSDAGNFDAGTIYVYGA